LNRKIKHAREAPGSRSRPLYHAAHGRPGMNLGHNQCINQWRDLEWHWRMAEWYYSAFPNDEHRCDGAYSGSTYSYSRLAEQLEICRIRTPRWIPNAWVHQALHDDHNPSELAAALFTKWMDKALVCCRVLYILHYALGRLLRMVVRNVRGRQGQVSICFNQSLWASTVRLSQHRGPGRCHVD